MNPQKREKYISAEGRRGSDAFNPSVTAVFRGKQCADLRRHFEPETALREIVSNADFFANRDPERFIYVMKWKKVREQYSQSTLDTYLRACERAGLFFPAQRFRKGKLRNGWIIKSHAELSRVIDGMCVLDIEFGRTGQPLRRNGERRWKSQGNHNQTTSGTGGLSVGMSVAVKPQSVGMSVGSSVGMSVAYADSECISDSPNERTDKELEGSALRKPALNPLSPVNPVNPEKENPVNPVPKHQNQPRSLLAAIDVDRKQNLGQEKTYGSMLSEVNYDYLRDGRFNEIVSFATRGGIEISKSKRYLHTEELARACVEVVESLSDLPWPSAPNSAYAVVMGRVMDNLKNKRLRVPSPWLPRLNQYRGEHTNMQEDFALPLSVSLPSRLSDAVELRELLLPPDAPLFYLENKHVTHAEYEQLVALSAKDYDAHPEFWTVVAHESEAQHREACSANV